MLHFVQHDSEASSKILRGNDINDYTKCHSERQRRIFIVKILHFVQHDSEWMISEVQTDISLPKKMGYRFPVAQIANITLAIRSSAGMNFQNFLRLILRTPKLSAPDGQEVTHSPQRLQSTDLTLPLRHGFMLM